MERLHAESHLKTLAREVQIALTDGFLDYELLNQPITFTKILLLNQILESIKVNIN